LRVIEVIDGFIEDDIKIYEKNYRVLTASQSSPVAGNQLNSVLKKPAVIEGCFATNAT
jgi:hypothetical protein